jgi:hypothetical protein
VSSMAASRPLRDHILALAGRADDDPRIAADLVGIAVLSADCVDGVAYASVTSRYAGAYETVAASSSLAVEIDRAQYADDAGPCLEALDGGYPAAVPEIAATMTWPGFRDVAVGLGLRASLSIPLFAGRGTTVAALNLYSHDPNAVKTLAAAVWAVYEAEPSPGPPAGELDAGGEELIAGLISAFSVRARVQQALGVLIATTGTSPDQAFDDLCSRAEAAGMSVPDEATRTVAEQRE